MSVNRRSRKLLAMLLALGLTLSAAAPAWADDGEPSLPEETVVQETVPQETAPQETVPATEPVEETQPVPEETVPPETQPQPEAPPQEPEVPAMSIQVPQFFQTDYPDVLYSNGTIATDGCSITCLAMVATYLTGHPYLPDELAGYFGGYMEGVITNLERLEAASDVLQLPWKRAADYHEAMKAVRDGKIVIVMMDAKSLFTSSQHFIVLVGTTEDGKILVNDPYQPNYSLWNLKNAFRYGFSAGDLCPGFSGAWIYDPEAMPEEPFIYHETREQVECRYPDVSLTPAERRLLAEMIWVEARGETGEGQQAVAEVVLNRLVSDGFSDNIRDIIYSDNQFRSIHWLDEAEPNQAQYDAIDAALNGPYILPLEVVHFATYPVTDRVWGTIGGHIFCYPPSQTNN